MFGLKELPYPPPKDTPPEDPKNLKPIGNTCELMQRISNSFAKAYITAFCPWVDINTLSEDQIARFSSAAFYGELLITGRAEINTPEDEAAFDKIFGDLIPEPTDEQLEEYRKMLEAYAAKEPQET